MAGHPVDDVSLEEGDLADYLAASRARPAPSPYVAALHAYSERHPPATVSRPAPLTYHTGSSPSFSSCTAPGTHPPTPGCIPHDASRYSPSFRSSPHGTVDRRGPGHETWIPGLDEPYFYDVGSSSNDSHRTRPHATRRAEPPTEDPDPLYGEAYGPSDGAHVVWEDEHGRLIGAHGTGCEHRASTGGPASEEKTKRRLKRLEGVFGAQSRDSASHLGDMDTPLSRSSNRLDLRLLDHRGRLAVKGRKRRIVARWIQGIGSLAVAGCLIATAFLIRPTKAPPPRGHAPYFILFPVSFASLALALWRAVVHHRGQGQSDRAQMASKSGLVVMPLHDGTGLSWDRSDDAWNCCSGRRGSKRRRMDGIGREPVVVNLLVDLHEVASLSAATPSARRPRAALRPSLDSEKRAPPRSSDEASDRDSLDLPTSQSEDTMEAASPLSPLQRLAYEGRVRSARKRVKQAMALDFLFSLIWFGWCIWDVGFGNKCPPGEYEGWCNVFNVAIAVSVFTGLAFVFSVSFGWKVLKLSKLATSF